MIIVLTNPPTTIKDNHKKITILTTKEAANRFCQTTHTTNKSEIEKIILTDTKATFHYATETLQTRFPEGEHLIAQHPNVASYIHTILQAPFPLAEPTIAKKPWASYHYAQQILKAPFPLGEPTIAKDPLTSLHYAKYVLKAPFPLGEPTIAKIGNIAYFYSKEILKGPFPQGAKAIARYLNKQQ